MTSKTTIDLPFTPADIKAKAIADHVWQRILNDDDLERARSRLSISDIQRIVAYCLEATVAT
jgi:hypothetical protein